MPGTYAITRRTRARAAARGAGRREDRAPGALGWEEIGVTVRLRRLLDVLGGPDYEVTYPNGDRVAYVPAVYEAEIADGNPAPADGELSEVAWFTPEELRCAPLSRFTRAVLTATGLVRRPGTGPSSGAR